MRGEERRIFSHCGDKRGCLLRDTPVATGGQPPGEPQQNGTAGVLLSGAADLPSCGQAQRHRIVFGSVPQLLPLRHHAAPSPGAEAWIASAWTPPSSSPTSVALIMRWHSSRLFPRNASATICTLK